MYRVLKRDGTTVDFEISKISGAMVKAFEALKKNYHPSVINLMALQVTSDFESKIKNDQITFSPIAVQQLEILTSAVDDIIDMTVTAFEKHDEDLARSIEPLEEVIDDMVQYLSNNHIDRLKAGECLPATGLYFMETLTYLERASDQCSSVAMLLLAIHDPKIRKNHHEYIHQLHKEKEGAYADQIAARRQQYLEPLVAIKAN